MIQITKTTQMVNTETVDQSPEMVQTSIKIPAPLQKKWKITAVQTDKSMQAVLIEALEHWLRLDPPKRISPSSVD